MPPATIYLGLPGDYTQSQDEATHYSTKVGGLACFPGDQCPMTHCPSCGVCGRELSLILQAYAPLNNAEHGATAPERCLYVYGCAHFGCGKAAKAWRVFRAQLPTPQEAVCNTIEQVSGKSVACNQQDTQNQAAISTIACSSGLPSNNLSNNGGAAGFGSDDDFFDDNHKFDDGSVAAKSNAFDFSDLNKELTAVSSQRVSPTTTAAKQAGKTDSKQDTSDQDSVVKSCSFSDKASNLLPEFYITAMEEPDGKLVGVKQKELEHIRHLLLEYEKEEQAIAEPNTGGVKTAFKWTGDLTLADDSDDDDSSMAMSSQPANDATAQDLNMMDDDALTAGDSKQNDEDKWEAEQYEEDEVRGVELHYLKFNQRVQREPNQCVRYCWDGQVLWPKQRAPDPGTCPHCGARRVFELQLMAPVVSIMLEAADDANIGKAGSSSVSKLPYGAVIADLNALTAAGNWDICTLAVYTCSKSCYGSNDSSHCRACWVEELAVLMNETDCHLPVQ